MMMTSLGFSCCDLSSTFILDSELAFHGLKDIPYTVMTVVQVRTGPSVQEFQKNICAEKLNGSEIES